MPDLSRLKQSAIEADIPKAKRFGNFSRADFPLACGKKAKKKTALKNQYGLFGDPDENRTRVTAVKGRCLNRLTTGPLVALTGFEPVTLRV